MGRFGSLGGGIADGVLAGQQINMQKAQIGLQKEQMAAEKQKRLAASLSAAREQTDAMFKELTTAAAQARAAGSSPESIAKIRQAAQAVAANYGITVEQMRAQLGAAGEDPSGVLPQGGGKAWVEQKMQMFDAMAGSAQTPEDARAIAVADAEAMLPVEAQRTEQTAKINAQAQEDKERRLGDFRVTQAARESAARSSAKVRVEGRPTTGPERDRNRLIDLRMMERSGSLSAKETEEKKLLESQLSDEDGTLDFGGSLIGKQHALLNNLRRIYRQTGSLTPEQQDAAKSAMHILRMPHQTKDANGNLVEIVPGVPPHLQELFAPTGTAPDESDLTLTRDDAMDLPNKESMTVSVSDTGSEVITLSEKDADWKGNIENALTHIKGAVDLLNGTGGKEKASAGFVGAVKSITNPIARQMGIPAESSTEQLKRKLALLSTVMAPIITNEKRITDTERTRVDKLVGQIGVLEDDIAIREILTEIVMFIQSKQGGQK